jgi:hypothetical protein
MHLGVARTASPDAPEIVPSDHCVHRFRQRLPLKDPGLHAVAELLIDALEDADVTRWPPGWAVTDTPAELWAISGDLAFPLARTPTPGRWLALTCLRRGRR